MLNLVRADFYKLFRSKAFYICAAISVALVVVIILAANLSYIAATDAISKAPTDDSSIQALSAFADMKPTGIWSIKQCFDFVSLFIGIFSSIFITLEFSSGTMKNIASRGFSRYKIFLSKFFVCSFVCFAFIILNLAAGMITGTALQGFGETTNHFLADFSRLFGLQLMVHIAITAIFVMVAFLIRQNGGTIAVNMCIIMVSGTILKLIDLLVDKISGKDFDINKYWIFEFRNLFSQLDIAQDDITRGIIVALSFLFGAIIIGTFAFSKTDIK